jgi:streptomycin 6-kinase
MKLEIPSEIIDNWNSWFGLKVSVNYQKQITERAYEAIDYWQLEAPTVLQGGRLALVVGDKRTGQCIKLNPRGWQTDLQHHEAQALRVWQGRGVVELLDSKDDDLTLLMPLLEGVSASDYVKDHLELMSLLANCLSRLQETKTSKAGFMPYSCNLLPHLPSNHSLYHQQRRTDKIQEELLDSMAEQCLLHTDLHANNLIIAPDGNKIVIDPKPAWGDPCAEVFGLMERLYWIHPKKRRDLLVKMLEVYSQTASLDSERVCKWLEVRLSANLLYSACCSLQTVKQKAWTSNLENILACITLASRS